MTKQVISKLKEMPYKEFTPPASEICRIFSLDRFARVFLGRRERIYGGDGISLGKCVAGRRRYCGSRRHKMALDQIAKLEREYIIRRGPRDFTPTTIRRYA